MTIDITTTAERVESLAQELSVRGMSADPVNVLLLAHTARDLGVHEVPISVMVDEEAPEVARLRAYAVVASAVTSRLVAATEERELQSVA